MRALRILLLGLTLVMLGTDAMAQEEDEDQAVDYSRTGMYVSASGVFVVERWPSSNKNAGADDTYGLNLRVGSRISQWASVELELELIDDFFPDEHQDFRAVTATANTRVYPMGGRIQPFALAGLGIVSTVVKHRDRDSSIKQSNADWGFRAGAGVDFYYTEHVAVSLEASHIFTVGDVKDIDHISIGVGLLYRF